MSDNDSNMILRQQLREMAKQENSNAQSDATYREIMEILRKLPSETVVTRHEVRVVTENSNYKELIEMNSSGSSSTSDCTAAETKRARNKTRETVEVRRNPMRLAKKNIYQDFTLSQQSLVNTKENCTNYEPKKRTKSIRRPSRKTRSVTRKTYGVGSIYQPPTKEDETVWREWPVHGMHERPVYHPQI